MHQTWPLLVVNSLERKDEPCKSYITLFEQMRDTLPQLVFISLEEKDIPSKMGVKKKVTDTLPLSVLGTMSVAMWIKLCN